MSPREKKILLLAAAVGVVFIATQGVPVLRDLYSSGDANREQLALQIEREQRLIDNAQQWQERRAEVEARSETLQQELFQDSSVALISANMQRLVRDYANQAEVTVTSTKLADSMETDGWLLVEQELSILTSNQNNILGLLNHIESSHPLLAVSAFSIRRNRNQYAGTVTVVGFSRSTGAVRAGGAD
ncbi:MAG: hypothetical protein H7A05_06025 [Pseudomonadales bacterium]|nr:hypothetical protein [Pseudomonadales bacterium]MCP5330224.1 hypothetical protein [Pseudomonadales bacterium]MCP5344159.1 hypothetical protein [Pseudomonadales bacterium]